MKLTAIQKMMKAAACLNHGGKMTGLISISTTPFNPVCDRRAANPASICAHCFSRRMMKASPAHR